MKNSLLITRSSLFILAALIVVQEGNAQPFRKESNQILYKLEEGKVFSTSDGGSRWKEGVPLPEGASFVVWNHSVPEHVIAVGTDAVYISFRGGQEWMPPWQLPPGFDPAALAISTSNPNVVYLTGSVAMRDGSLRSTAWVSKNMGMKWHEMHLSAAATATLSDSSKFWFAVPDIPTKHQERWR